MPKGHGNEDSSLRAGVVNLKITCRDSSCSKRGALNLTHYLKMMPHGKDNGTKDNNEKLGTFCGQGCQLVKCPEENRTEGDFHSTSLAAFVTFVCDVNLYNNCDKDQGKFSLATCHRKCSSGLPFSQILCMLYKQRDI